MVLAVPSPANGVAGVDVTAAFWNAQVRDAVTFLANPPMCVALATVVQSIPNNTWTSLLLNSNRVDSYAGHSVSVNTNRYVAQVAGWYRVYGVAPFASATIAARLAINGTADNGSATTGAGGAAVGLATVTAEDLVYLAVGNYVEMHVYQSTGAAFNTSTTATDYAPAMNVHWMHA